MSNEKNFDKLLRAAYEKEEFGYFPVLLQLLASNNNEVAKKVRAALNERSQDAFRKLFDIEKGKKGIDKLDISSKILEVIKSTIIHLDLLTYLKKYNVVEQEMSVEDLTKVVVGSLQSMVKSLGKAKAKMNTVEDSSEKTFGYLYDKLVENARAHIPSPVKKTWGWLTHWGGEYLPDPEPYVRKILLRGYGSTPRERKEIIKSPSYSYSNLLYGKRFASLINGFYLNLAEFILSVIVLIIWLTVGECKIILWDVNMNNLDYLIRRGVIQGNMSGEDEGETQNVPVFYNPDIQNFVNLQQEVSGILEL